MNDKGNRAAAKQPGFQNTAGRRLRLTDLLCGGSMALHEENKTLTVDWLTPKYIIDAFPEFDLDPCASVHQQWNTAKNMIRLPDDGLQADWFGRVWLNPPYGHRVIEPWLKRMAEHGNGVALVFARTETQWFHRCVWPFASGLFFFRGRLSYVHGKAASERQAYGGIRRRVPRIGAKREVGWSICGRR